MSTPTTSPRSGEQTASPAHVTGDRVVAVPHLLDWLRSELAAFPPLAHGGHEREMRAEQYVEGDRLVLRVELPAVDPERDIDVTVAGGVLTVRADRREVHEGTGHSEFFYGTLLRTFVLPPGAVEQGVTAVYRDGVLELAIPLGHAHDAGRKITVTRGG